MRKMQGFSQSRIIKKKYSDHNWIQKIAHFRYDTLFVRLLGTPLTHTHTSMHTHTHTHTLTYAYSLWHYRPFPWVGSWDINSLLLFWNHPTPPISFHWSVPWVSISKYSLVIMSQLPLLLSSGLTWPSWRMPTPSYSRTTTSWSKRARTERWPHYLASVKQKSV